MIIVTTGDGPSDALTWNVSNYLSPFISLQPPGLNFDLDALNLSGPPGASGEQCLIMWNTTRFLPDSQPWGMSGVSRTTGSWGRNVAYGSGLPAALCHPTQDGANTNWGFFPCLSRNKTCSAGHFCRPFWLWFLLLAKAQIATYQVKEGFLGSMHLPSPKITLHLPILMFTFVPRVFVPCLHSLLWGLGSRDIILGLYFCSFLGRAFGNEWGVTLPRLELHVCHHALLPSGRPFWILWKESKWRLVQLMIVGLKEKSWDSPLLRCWALNSLFQPENSSCCPHSFHNAMWSGWIQPLTFLCLSYLPSFKNIHFFQPFSKPKLTKKGPFCFPSSSPSTVFTGPFSPW